MTPKPRAASPSSRAHPKRAASHALVMRLAEVATLPDPGRALGSLCRLVLDFVDCDGVAVFLRRGGSLERCTRTRRPTAGGPTRARARSQPPGSIVDGFVREYLAPGADGVGTLLWNGKWSARGGELPGPRLQRSLQRCLPATNWGAGAFLPLTLGTRRDGLLLLKFAARRRFDPIQARFFEAVARVVSAVLANRFADAVLRERVKELTCLHTITRLRARRGDTTDEQLQRIVRALPPAWLYPDFAGARIQIDGKEFHTRVPGKNARRLSAGIHVRGEGRGAVEVFYDTPLPEADEGPFLKEERRLLETIAKELTLMFERKLAEDEEARTLAQLRHADRLATIGRLSAGVAHEINEPLSSILGFTQLVQKHAGLPGQVRQDLLRIETAALQARQVVQSLLLFARQAPPRRDRVELARVIRGALSLLAPQLAAQRVEAVLRLDPSLPVIDGDSMQLQQVVVNLVANAIQAMPEGGRLTLETVSEEAALCLVVEDDGTGMSAEVAEQAFLPFFTTKDVGRGTGLGLSVVHGIVSAHGGGVRLHSREGAGTRLEVRLPLAGAARDGDDA